MVGSKCRDFKNREVSNVNAPTVKQGAKWALAWLPWASGSWILISTSEHHRKPVAWIWQVNFFTKSELFPLVYLNTKVNILFLFGQVKAFFFVQVLFSNSLVRIGKCWKTKKLGRTIPLERKSEAVLHLNFHMIYQRVILHLIVLNWICRQQLTSIVISGISGLWPGGGGGGGFEKCSLYPL